LSEERRIREALRSWVVGTSGRIGADQLRDDTTIFSEAVLESVHVMELILLIEELSRREIDVEKLKVGVFRNVDAIVANFFRSDESYFAD
jgi:acyl carrier protein